MVTEQVEAPPTRAALKGERKRKPPTPARLQKRKLTLSDAADQWESAKRESERLKALLEEAAVVLHAHFDRTGRATYRDRIVRESTGGNLVLDQPKVKELLGDKLPEYQTRTKLGWTLKLLK